MKHLGDGRYLVAQIGDWMLIYFAFSYFLRHSCNGFYNGTALIGHGNPDLVSSSCMHCGERYPKQVKMAIKLLLMLGEDDGV